MAKYPFCVVDDIEKVIRQNFASAKDFSTSTSPTLVEVNSMMDEVASEIRSTASTAGYDVDNFHETDTTLTSAAYSGGTAIHTADFSAGVDNFSDTNLTTTGNVDYLGETNTMSCEFTSTTANLTLTAANFDNTTGFVRGRKYHIKFKYYVNPYSASTRVCGVFTNGSDTLKKLDGTTNLSTLTLTEEAWTTQNWYVTIPATATSVGIYFIFEGNVIGDMLYIAELVITPVYALTTSTGFEEGSVVKLEGTYSGRVWEFSEVTLFDSTEGGVGMTLTNSYDSAPTVYIVNDALWILRRLNAIGAAERALRATQGGFGTKAIEYADKLLEMYRGSEETRSGLWAIANIEDYLLGATTTTTALDSYTIQSYGSEHSDDADVEPVITRETEF